MARRPRHDKSRLPERELAICRRLREAREIAGITQEQLAGEIGIPRDRLSTYEKGRAPIKSDLGLRICRQLIFSEEWLATGETSTFTKRISGPRMMLKTLKERVFPRHCLDLLSEPVASSIAPATLFSTAFDTKLRTAYEVLANSLPLLSPPRIVLSIALAEPELVARLVQVIFDRQLALIGLQAPDYEAAPWPIQRSFTELVFLLCNELARVAWHADFDAPKFQDLVLPAIVHWLAKFDDDQKERADELRKPRQAEDAPSENFVAEPDSKHILRFMLWPELSTWEGARTQLKLALDFKRGAKAALARRFGVTTQAVSQWLSGASMPSADTAFHIRKLLADGSLTTQHKKRAGSASTRPALKTRKSKSTSHEKAKSGPSEKG